MAGHLGYPGPSIVSFGDRFFYQQSSVLSCLCTALRQIADFVSDDREPKTYLACAASTAVLSASMLV
jgi:hypothetical protein